MQDEPPYGVWQDLQDDYLIFFILPILRLLCSRILHIL